jgi:hypothetical protein
MTTKSITILAVNYFGNDDSKDFNAKAVYTKNGKTYHACIDIDYFHNRVYIPRQPKECKVMAGFHQAINTHQGF